MGDNDTLLMVLLWVLGGVCVAGKWREPGHCGWHCDQSDRAERSLCLLVFKLAQKLRQGEKRGRGHEDTTRMVQKKANKA